MLKMEVVFKKVYDLSVHNGMVDWEQLKADGVEFVMLRAGYGKNNIDERFYDNASACVRLGIPFGVYWFSYAYTVEMAEQEAEYAIAAVCKYRLRCPVSFDLEYDTVRYAATKGVAINKALASQMVEAFCSRIGRAGFEAWNYSNKDYLYRMFDSALLEKYPLWFARYNDYPGQTGMVMWQRSSSGQVNGISGRVDLNYAYRKLESIGHETEVPGTIEALPGTASYLVGRDGDKYFTLDGKRTNFKAKEFACKDGTDIVKVNRTLVQMLQQIREHFGQPVIINSGYRTIAYNSKVGGAKSSYHLDGQAADIRISGIAPIKVAAYAESLGVQGIGLYASFTHVDIRNQRYYWVNASGNSVSTFGTGNPYQQPAAGSVLRNGSRGDGVKWLQTELNLEEYGLSVDGIYGAKTTQAVRDYQYKKGLKVDGLAGPVTIGRLAG